MTNQDSEKTRRRLLPRIPMWVGALLGTFAVIFVLLSLRFIDEIGWVPFKTLPTDEEMIANFSKHRADFERLVKIYEEDLSVPTDVVGQLLPTPQVRSLMDRLNVASIISDGQIWIPPDPYSLEPKFLRERVRLQSSIQSAEARRLSGPMFSHVHGRVTRLEYLQPVYKSYHYIPSAPKINNGVLITPGTPATGYPRLYGSLNAYPPDFATFSCAYKQIDARWFIGMCQHKHFKGE